MNDSMRQLIGVVNRLSDACVRSQVKLGLEFPQICVVGGQSVGKSSVLESIVGKEFLPRGNGIVTRCPLIMQCKQSEEEYATFLHDPKKVYRDFDEVRQEIEAQTGRLCGKNRGITHQTITLTIHSPHVLDLTLVDLPGITRVAVGDQPADIEKQTLDLVINHVEHANVVILAVSAANVDLANSDAMKVVKQVDPHGKRTIGVLTKLDIMDQGTHARDILTNQVFRLKLGYIGVVNRSQDDLDKGVPVEEVRAKEARFFAQHPQYRDLAERMGIPYLQQVLSRELSAHVDRTLPDMISILKTKKRDAEHELDRLQDRQLPDNVLDVKLHDYANLIQTEIKGVPGNIKMNEIAGGAKLKSMFYNEFADKLALSNFILSEEDFQRKIETVIRNIHAINNGVFIPNQAFNEMTKAIIREYSKPVVECVDAAGQKLREITAEAAELLTDFPRLQEAVNYLMNTHILKQEEETKNHLLVLVSAEGSFQNTQHEDYLSAVQKQPLPALGAHAAHKRLPRTGQTKGRVVIKNKGANQDIWLVVTPDTLKLFKNEQEDEHVIFVHVDSKLRMQKENGGKELRLIIARSDGRGLGPDNKTLEFIFKDDGTLDKWARCLEANGISQQNDDGEFMMLDPREGQGARARMQRSRSEMQEILTRDRPGDDDVETVKQMVKSYMTVVAKTVRDLVPKYVVFLLVENTEKFAICELSSRVRTGYDLKSLLDRDEEVQARIENLMREYSTSEDALSIINEYYTHKRTGDYRRQRSFSPLK